MTREQYKSATGIFSTQLAIGSFLVGTLLLIMHLIDPSGELFATGFIYLALATIINLLVLLKLWFLYITQKKPSRILYHQNSHSTHQHSYCLCLFEDSRRNLEIA